MMNGACYCVASPENRTMGSAWPPEPPDTWVDVVFVYARDPRRAKVLALRWFRRRYKCWERRDRYYLSDNHVNPFDGMTAVECQRQPYGWRASETAEAF